MQKLEGAANHMQHLFNLLFHNISTNLNGATESKIDFLFDNIIK
jgi:hypothetical protein